jgi:hypothetical protein
MIKCIKEHKWQTIMLILYIVQIGGISYGIKLHKTIIGEINQIYIYIHTHFTTNMNIHLILFL